LDSHHPTTERRKGGEMKEFGFLYYKIKRKINL
jgi:hypothetical protein